ncbi:hypothetical protein [Candidatus Poriferisodalis sp.]|uniref:hypothetical protein n=1 Tax=Candidatus Poriferisodalis sp. TaxID=3101277 RepID=UPI003AF71F88
MSAVPNTWCRRSGKEMMIVKARWARLGAGLAALVLVAAACGGGADDDGGGEVVTHAATQETSAPATTAAPTTTPATTAAALPTDAKELVTVALQNSATRSVKGDMRMDMGDLATVAVHFESDGNQNFSMLMSFEEMMGAGEAGFGFEIRFVDGVQYLQFAVPEEMSDLVGDAMPQGWFTLDAETAAAMGIVCPSALPGATPDDGLCRLPNDSTDMIENVTSAEIVGPEELDGVPTTRVRFILDYAAALDAYLAEPEGSDSALPFVGDMFPDEVAYDIWIDAEGLTRRMSVDLGSLMENLIGGLDDAETEGHEDEIASLFNITNVVDFYDYDADITIEAPPADEIVGDFGDMMGEGFGAAG